MLVLCYREVYEYGCRIGGPIVVRWEHNDLLQREFGGGPDSEIEAALALEDMLMAADWTTLDVSKVDLRYYFLLRDKAESSLHSLSSVGW